jgi:GT2 family glycosyltransferase
MKLSVIVATRNRPHAIAGCLDSIAASLAKAVPLDAEIVMVDNGSQDATSRIVEQWATGSAFPVRLLVEPRAGLLTGSLPHLQQLFLHEKLFNEWPLFWGKALESLYYI